MKDVSTGAKFAKTFSISKFIQTYHAFTDPKLVKDFITDFKRDLRYVHLIFFYQVFMHLLNFSVWGHLSLTYVI